MFDLIEISQGIKTFSVYLKALLEKLFQTLYSSLKNSFEKIGFQNTTLHLLESYASFIAKEVFPK
jgi:hypothetical protein